MIKSVLRLRRKQAARDDWLGLASDQSATTETAKLRSHCLVIDGDPLGLSTESKICTGAIMPTPEQAQQDLDNYRQAVQDVAENVIAELNDADTDTDRDELLTQLVDERCDQHDYVINDELQIHTLLYSGHPCAGFFNGTFSARGRNSTDAFPFAELAADAFEMDVTEKVKELLEGHDA